MKIDGMTLTFSKQVLYVGPRKFIYWSLSVLEFKHRIPNSSSPNLFFINVIAPDYIRSAKRQHNYCTYVRQWSEMKRETARARREVPRV